MKEYKYATVEYKATVYQLRKIGIEVDVQDEKVVTTRTGLFLGISRYGDEDGADTYLMVIDADTGFVVECNPQNVRFDLKRGVIQ